MLAGNGGVAGERHISVPKAAAIGGGAALTAMLAASAGLETQTLTYSAFDFLFPAACFSALAGLAAQITPAMLASQNEHLHSAIEQAHLDAVAALDDGQPLPWGGDAHELVRSDIEWIRWEGNDRENWDHQKRGRWAETLWQAQITRRTEKRRMEEVLRLNEERRRAAESRQQRRQARWGSAHHR
jgi:hypothetical protein